MTVVPGTERSCGVRIDPRDVRTDVYRDSGAGGQHRNTTDSAVRLTHLPTGVVVTAAEDRSQHTNRRVAWARLEAAVERKTSSQMQREANDAKAAFFGGSRTWTWCAWRDQVTAPSGASASMKKVLRGDFRVLLR